MLSLIITNIFGVPVDLVPFSILTVFKLIFVLFLIILTIYLYFENSLPKPSPKVRESGLMSKNFKNILFYGSTAATFISTGLALKSDIVAGKLESNQQLLLTNREVLANTIKDLSKVKDEFQDLEAKRIAVRMINYKIDIKYNALQESTTNLLSEAIILRDIIDSPILSVTDKISRIRDFKNASVGFDRTLQDFQTLSDTLALISSNTESSLPDTNPLPNISLNTNPEIKDMDILKEDIVKSSIINWEWFELLTAWEKLAVSLLLSKSIIFSALCGIIFNFYGDILLSKYNIESRFPKLATVIKLRRTFARYYILFDCGLILAVIILEVVFSLFILQISLS